MPPLCQVLYKDQRLVTGLNCNSVSQLRHVVHARAKCFQTLTLAYCTSATDCR
jgi:hypothetical protein